MRPHSGRRSIPGELRHRVERLRHLPIRPSTARPFMAALPDVHGDGESAPPHLERSRFAATWDIDPGWVLGEMYPMFRGDPVRLVAELPWWPAFGATHMFAETFQRLWRHSVAVSIAARWLAKEGGDPDPDALGRAGLLHGLGYWAVAAVDPQWVVRWLGEQDPRARRQWETSEFGTDLRDLGRRLAERWGCPTLIVESAWLHADSAESIGKLASEAQRLSFIQRAYRWAEKTPWALAPDPGHEFMPAEPRLRILIAEVQSRCGSPFAAADATAHEENMTRRAARLTLQLHDSQRSLATRERLLQAMAATDPADTPETWADRVGIHWCAEPEATASRVVWKLSPSAIAQEVESEEPADDPGQAGAPSIAETPPTLVLPLTVRGNPAAEVLLWCDRAEPDLGARLSSSSVLPAWEAWASMIFDRWVLETRLRTLVAAVREQFDDQEVRARDARLEALAEFAAGAGHELNNPLAVIVGRAQLLLGRAGDPETVRSLQIILAQAQRTHRILRDLMFVARPPAPRPRACRPAEILRTSIASFQDECQARQIRLAGEIDGGEMKSWSDPEALGHLADILLRNAIQATPPGGRIQVRSSRQGGELKWWFTDSGRGVSPAEGAHLFDPFYCGRQAGRGLGLGLPRAGRIAALAGGTLSWSSEAGRGTTFQVSLPLTDPPDQVGREAYSARETPGPSAGSPKN